MIELTEIEIRGESDAGPFAGTLEFSSGLHVVSARNGYGKSMAVTAVAWCLGIEPIFGNLDNDATCFKEAARDEIELPGRPPAKVVSSECSITIRHKDGRQLRLARAIKGDCETVEVEEYSSNGKARKSKLLARRHTMQDEHGGLQHFLFEWLKWPRENVTTFRGTNSEIYLENIAPAFYINQDEGWTDLQALQIGRYGQQQIAEIVVEFLLGATDTIKARVARQQAAQRNAVLRESAQRIAERVSATLLRRGWRMDWSGYGSVEDTLARWSSCTLRDALKKDADLDLSDMQVSLEKRAEQLRRALMSEPIDPANASAPAAASQKVIELKQRRHALSEELHTLRAQHEQTSELVDSLEHRIHAANDLLRLKTTGVGRLDHMECPTCHRDLDAETFALTDQSKDSISKHIEALKRDRELTRKNLHSLEDSLTTTSGVLMNIDENFRDAERALITVTAAVGTVREQVAQTGAELAATEREIDRFMGASNEIDELQGEVNRWITEARSMAQLSITAPDLKPRRDAFLDALRKYLIALGHSAVRPEVLDYLDLDDQYVPYLNKRRLRSLGSASDQARLIAAYSLALAAGSERIGGLHPGVVILDEPLQQNPDDPHRELFLGFLNQELARREKFQTLIFTWLRDDEIGQLREQGTNVMTPEGDHFLQLIPPNTHGLRK